MKDLMLQMLQAEEASSSSLVELSSRPVELPLNRHLDLV